MLPLRAFRFRATKERGTRIYRSPTATIHNPALYRPHPRDGCHPKMAPALIGEAQHMYESKQFTMTETTSPYGVTHMTIYRNLRNLPTDRPAPAAAHQGAAR